MNCQDARLLLHAYLDDELDAAAGLEVARHLAACPACAQRFRLHGQLRDGLRGADLYRPAPATLRARITAQWPRTVYAPARNAPRRRGYALAALAAMLVIAAVLAGWQTLQLRRQDADALVAEAVSGHLRSLLPGHLMDVQTSSQHTVKPWFDGRLDYSPQVRDLSAQGFELAGARLDVLEGRRVAALVYKRRLHMINLYEWPDQHAAPAGVRSRNGYHVLQWQDAGMRYVAVSNIGEDDLAAFARAFRATSKSGSEPAR